MSIEHRWTPRHPVRLLVSIDCRPLGTLRGRLRDISNGGAMVQLPTALRPFTPVELVLPLQAGGSKRSCRIPAIVARCGKTGTGLMFDRIESDAWQALLAELLPHAKIDTEIGNAPPKRSAPIPSRS